MKAFPLLLTIAFACKAVCTSNLRLYAINPFNISKSVSGQAGSQPFGLRTLNPQDIHQGPILILTPKFEEQPNTKILYAFFIPNGMSSLSLNSKFEALYNSFLQFKLSGLVLFPGSYGRRILALSVIKDVTTPDSFKATELLRFIDNPSIPVVYIAPNEVFHLQDLYPLNNFAVFRFQNETVILSETFGTFYYPIDEGNVVPIALEMPH